MKKYNVGAVNWGLVAGKTQTYYPWNWNEKKGEPKVWFHDIFRTDGTPYIIEEVDYIHSMTGKK